MKKVVMFFGLLLLIPLVVFGQEPEVPQSWAEVIMNFNVWFGTLAGIAAVTVFIGGAVFKVLKVEKRLVKQLIVWGISILLVVAGNIFNLGFSADFPWWTTLAYGFAAGLVANGIFTIDVVKSLLEILKLKQVK